MAIQVNPEVQSPQTCRENMPLHFWLSHSHERRMKHRIGGWTTPEAHIGRQVLPYSYCNEDRNCELPPSIRDNEDLVYLGEGYIIE